MRTRPLAARAAASALLVASLAACGAQGYYDGPAYVVGTYTCTNPSSGQPDYCVEYSDGSSQVVPFWIYNSVGYGYTVSYTSHRSWITTRTSFYTGRRAPDVYHVHYVQYHYRTGGTTTYSSYGGMSYRTKAGRVVYRSAATGVSYHSSSYSYGRH